MGSNGLEAVDSTSNKIPRHKMASSKESTLETPDDLKYYLTNKHDNICQ